MSRLQKRIFITLAVFAFLIGIVFYCFISYLSSPNHYPISSSELGIIYHCNPYFLEESSLGETYDLEELMMNSSICKHHGYYSAVKSYSKNDSNLIIDVYFVKLKGQDLYTLDQQFISKFNKLSLHEDLLKGSVHRLIYSYEHQKYTLTQLQSLQ